MRGRKRRWRPAAAPRGGNAGCCRAPRCRRPVLQMRFVAIWLALAALLVDRRPRRSAQPAALQHHGRHSARRLPHHRHDGADAGADDARHRPVDSGCRHAVQHAAARRFRRFRLRPCRRDRGGAARRDRDRPPQRLPGRAAAAERADRDAGGRRDPVGRHAVVPARPAGRIRRAAAACRLGRLAARRRQRLGVGGRGDGRGADHRPAQDDDRPALLGGRRQPARRAHSPASACRSTRSPPSRSPACSTASPASCCRPSSAIRRSMSATPICSRRSRPRCSAAPR